MKNGFIRFITFILCTIALGLPIYRSIMDVLSLAVIAGIISGILAMFLSFLIIVK